MIATEANPVVSAAAADLRGGGKQDLVLAESNSVTGTAPEAVVVLLGNGDGTFQSGVDYTENVAPIAVAIGDVNKDGIPDLVIASTTNGAVSTNLYTLPGKG